MGCRQEAGFYLMADCRKAEESSRLKRAKDLGDCDYSGAFAQIRFLPVGHLRRNS